MFGGVTPPPITDDQSGDGFRESEAYDFKNKSDSEKAIIIKQDNENMIIMLSHWIVNNN